MMGEGLDRIGKGVWERDRWKEATVRGQEHRREPQWWEGQGVCPAVGSPWLRSACPQGCSSCRPHVTRACLLHQRQAGGLG